MLFANELLNTKYYGIGIKKSQIVENLRKYTVLKGYPQEYIAEYFGKRGYPASS